jgi:chitin disaccharide deacetylase
LAGSRYLIVNADDFGFTRDVNQGIVDAHLTGVLTATTLMANGDAFEDAVRLATQTPTLDVGCHLVLVQGDSVLTRKPLPAGPKELIAALLAARLDPYLEFKAQVEKLLHAGVRPSHLDTHKHTHVLPAVLSAVMRVAADFNIPFIRLPFDSGWALVRPLERWYRRKLLRRNLGSTDHFVGFRLTDHLSEETLAQTVRTLPSGWTELMCHPGYLGDELQGARTRLKQERERELNALTSVRIRQLVTECNVCLRNYRELAELRRRQSS